MSYVEDFAKVDARVRAAVKSHTQLTLFGSGPKICITGEGLFVSVGVQIRGVDQPLDITGTGETPDAAAEDLITNFGTWVRMYQGR